MIVSVPAPGPVIVIGLVIVGSSLARLIDPDKPDTKAIVFDPPLALAWLIASRRLPGLAGVASPVLVTVYVLASATLPESRVAASASPPPAAIERPDTAA